VVGLEPDADRYDVAQRVAAFYGDRWEIVQATPEQYETQERFDIVTCMNVLHHTPDPISLLRRLADLTAGELVVEFCVADDRGYIRDVIGGDGPGAHLRARLRSSLLRAAAGNLPILAVGNREYHRVFYFSRAGFTNLVKTHLKLFDEVVFAPSPTGRRRVIAYCRRTAAS
jgi:SAM-dependent methyltransferase